MPLSFKALSGRFYGNFNDMLVSCSSENKEAIILGDFNVNYLNNGQDKEIKDTFHLYRYKQIVKKATRVTKW